MYWIMRLSVPLSSILVAFSQEISFVLFKKKIKKEEKKILVKFCSNLWVLCIEGYLDLVSFYYTLQK